jgi:two-component system, NtrC family, sensor kinase
MHVASWQTAKFNLLFSAVVLIKGFPYLACKSPNFINLLSQSPAATNTFMKPLYFLLFYLVNFLSVCYSQNSDSNVIRIDTIPASGILLDKGWKFHPGDNPNWSNPEYNDSDWKPINPTRGIRDIPELQKISVYWFRLTLQVDSSLMDESLGILLSQVGASEIYLDGKLLYKFGTIDLGNEKGISTYYILHKPFVIKLDHRPTQVLSIRYAFEPKSFLASFQAYCFNAIVNTVPKTFSNYREEDRRERIYETSVMSLWLLLTIVCFCLYFLYRSQKPYLYMGVTAFLVFCYRFIESEVPEEMLSTTNSVSVAHFISSMLALLSNFFSFNALYLLFKQKKPKFYYIIVLVRLFSACSFFLFPPVAGLLWGLCFLLASIELFRISIKAFRNKRAGAVILIGTYFLWISSIVFAVVTLLMNLIGLAYFLQLFGSFSNAIGLGTFIAGEFARTGLALRARVKEVEELSEEKHRILSAQNIVLEKQVLQRTAQLENSLAELKATQAQLIQSEKMASLGELTAGIAHEIQNPLNFVNNFSEVNKELLADMKGEIEKGNLDEVKSIANDVIENQEKINHHGKRAEGIVKGMLQHSRISSGHKELTDMNALADEYVRLAYHGLRAKDKSFNAEIKTDFDKTIGKINVVPPDIGRVLLNLINNAFYAVSERQKVEGLGYKPTVFVSTAKQNGKIEITVKDNGHGVPQNIVEKIFQPFFTTKPAGQGTGLGLSLAYDIVKAHGGEIKVETKEGEGSEFTIQLPIDNLNT